MKFINFRPHGSKNRGDRKANSTLNLIVPEKNVYMQTKHRDEDESWEKQRQFRRNACKL